MYCESFAALSSPLADSYTTAHGTVMDFWARVTPGILQLLSHSKVVSLFHMKLDAICFQIQDPLSWPVLGELYWDNRSIYW